MAIRTWIITGETPGGVRSLAWLSITDDGDVSAGLSDRDVRIQSPGGSQAHARNPHFTFHPPIHHHLRQTGAPKIMAGLMEISAMLRENVVVPWVRIVSRPMRLLKSAGNIRKGIEVRFQFPDEDRSATVAIDFASTPLKSAFEVPTILGMLVRVSVISCTPSQASLTLLWQG